MNNIDQLRRGLKEALFSVAKPELWGMPQLMSKALKEVRATFDNPLASYSSTTISNTLINFRRNETFPSFREIKYACFGIGQKIGTEGWRLINDPSLFIRLLDEVEKKRQEPRLFRKCFQGLLAGYFGCPIFSSEISQNGRLNWERLRSYLHDNLPTILNIPPVFGWVKSIYEHRNLMRENPCNRYKEDLLKDDLGNLKVICNELGVPSDSWVWEEAVLTQVRSICELGDGAFKEHLDKMLPKFSEENRRIFSENLSMRCLSSLVGRYSNCSSCPEHPLLRDLAVTKIGNPWLKRTAWDAYVKNEKARKMVDGWLKRNLVTDFFALLSEDGSADKRRLNYWLRYVNEIEDMWYALGPYARNHVGSDFKRVRSLAKGRLLNLDGGGRAENNAFIMLINKMIVVEFGQVGNACYFFRIEQLPFRLDGHYIRANSELKSIQHHNRFIHRDNMSTMVSWEERLDDWFSREIGWKPSPKPFSLNSKTLLLNKKQAQTPFPKNNHEKISGRQLFGIGDFVRFINKYKLCVTDNRKKGGALWVLTDDFNYITSDQLKAWGFRYKAGKGWWKE